MVIFPMKTWGLISHCRATHVGPHPPSAVGVFAAGYRRLWSNGIEVPQVRRKGVDTLW